MKVIGSYSKYAINHENGIARILKRHDEHELNELAMGNDETKVNFLFKSKK